MGAWTCRLVHTGWQRNLGTPPHSGGGPLQKPQTRDRRTYGPGSSLPTGRSSPLAVLGKLRFLSHLCRPMVQPSLPGPRRGAAQLPRHKAYSIHHTFTIHMSPIIYLALLIGRLPCSTAASADATFAKTTAQSDHPHDPDPVFRPIYIYTHIPFVSFLCFYA